MEILRQKLKADKKLVVAQALAEEVLKSEQAAVVLSPRPSRRS
jgi:hypothetical protein